MNHSDSIKNIAIAMNAVQERALMASENSDNPFFHSKYADLKSVWDACRKGLHDNGLSIIQTVESGVEGVTLDTTLLHVSGEWISSSYPIVVTKQEPQAYGSAVTYARRYALAAMVGVIAGDDDAEGAVGRKEASLDSEATKDAVSNVTGEGGTYSSGTKEFDRVGWIAFLTNVAKKYGVPLKQTTGMKHSDLQQYGLEVLQAAQAVKRGATVKAPSEDL